MKFERYIYIDSDGDVEHVDKVQQNYRNRLFCIHIETEIPEEFFKTPTVHIKTGNVELQAGIFEQWLSSDSGITLEGKTKVDDKTEGEDDLPY